MVQGKTDDAGNETTLPATYTYSRTTDDVLKTMTTSVSGPAGPNSVTTVMVSDNDPFSPQHGLLKEQRLEVGGVTKSKEEFFYDNPASGQGSSGLQRNKVITTDDGSPANQTRTDFLYGQYGRLITTTEFGFPTAGGNFRPRRRTEYMYLDTAAYIAAAFYHLVTFMTVWDAKETNDELDLDPRRHGEQLSTSFHSRAKQLDGPRSNLARRQRSGLRRVRAATTLA